MLNRAKLVAKLENVIGPDHALTRILRDILAYNYVQIDDNIAISRYITQTNEVLQGDPLSPLLFNIATIDSAQAILQGPTNTKLYIYADDMVLVSKSEQELQEAFNDLHDWSQENDFTINKKKTVSMVFWIGGKLAETDFICCNGERLKNVNFRSLGVTLQTSGKSFKQHVKERALAALRAMHDIENLRLHSLKTAMKLFSAKITPILTYGLEQIEHLTVNDLTTLENVKATYLTGHSVCQV
jgi:hypothetical protein